MRKGQRGHSTGTVLVTPKTQNLGFWYDAVCHFHFIQPAFIYKIYLCYWTVAVLLRLVVAMMWFISPFVSELIHWHWSNHTNDVLEVTGISLYMLNVFILMHKWFMCVYCYMPMYFMLCKHFHHVLCQKWQNKPVKSPMKCFKKICKLDSFSHSKTQQSMKRAHKCGGAQHPEKWLCIGLNIDLNILHDISKLILCITKLITYTITMKLDERMNPYMTLLYMGMW